MLDKNLLEKALLIGIVKQKNWKVLVLNGLTSDYFSPVNKSMYDYIYNCICADKYPELPVLAYQFEIDDDMMATCLEASDLDEMCNALRNDYLKTRVKYDVAQLNDYSDELNRNPSNFIDRLGDVYNGLKLLGTTNHSVGLLDDIEKVLEIDPNNVVSTGFKELDKTLIGWKRGEELAVFMARTNKGKSWMGLKFALAAAMNGEKVGIYSGEMSKQQLQERIICCAKPEYTSTKEESLKLLQDKKLDIRLLTQKELRRKANVTDLEEMIIRDSLTMLVVDQLSLMDDNSSKPGTPLRQQYGNITNDLYSISTRYNIPIILLVQSNRNGAQEQNGPVIENIAESDAVGQNASRVISMNNENGIMTLNIVKNRYGPVGMMQKYEIDFSINKYKPIKEMSQEATSIKRAKARQIFGSGGAVF